MSTEPKMQAVDWGKAGGKSLIVLTVSPGTHTKTKINDAIAWLKKEYPGAEIQVRGLEGSPGNKSVEGL